MRHGQLNTVATGPALVTKGSDHIDSMWERPPGEPRLTGARSAPEAVLDTLDADPADAMLEMVMRRFWHALRPKSRDMSERAPGVDRHNPHVLDRLARRGPSEAAIERSPDGMVMVGAAEAEACASRCDNLWRADAPTMDMLSTYTASRPHSA